MSKNSEVSKDQKNQKAHRRDFSTARILVTRTDRLGDVLLATPVLRRIRECYPQAELYFLVQKQWMSILPSSLLPRSFLPRSLEQVSGPGVVLLEYNPKMPGNELTELLKQKKFDVAIVLRDEKKITKAVRRAKIPVRVGPYSSLRSFFAFNAGLLQKRSQCKMHEAEYNLELLSKIGVRANAPAAKASELPRSWIQIAEEADPAAQLQTLELPPQVAVQQFLEKNSLQRKKFICFHPGSSGSARYLSTPQMIELAKIIVQRGHDLVLTGSEAEASLLEEIHQAVPNTKIFGGKDARPLGELAALYESAQGMIAHGTGPLHLAAATSTAVLAIFPPIFVLSEKRWGPLTERRVTWVPPLLKCPAKYKCKGPRCEYFDCMERFAATEVLQQFEKIL